MPVSISVLVNISLMPSRINPPITTPAVICKINFIVSSLSFDLLFLVSVFFGFF